MKFIKEKIISKLWYGFRMHWNILRNLIILWKPLWVIWTSDDGVLVDYFGQWLCQNVSEINVAEIVLSSSHFTVLSMISTKICTMNWMLPHLCSIHLWNCDIRLIFLTCDIPAQFTCVVIQNTLQIFSFHYCTMNKLFK